MTLINLKYYFNKLFFYFKVITIYLLFNFPSAFSQTYDEIQKLSFKQTFRIRAAFKKSDGGLTYRYGAGMIFKGRYLFTCAHLTQSTPTESLVSVLVRYNQRVQGNVVASDSVFVDLAHKQNYVQQRISMELKKNTDNVILKLAETIPITEYKLAQQSFNAVEAPVYAYGFHFVELPDGRRYSSLFAASKAVHILKKSSNLPKTIISLGNVYAGFSGSPLYNSKGEVIGVIYAGYDTIQKSMLDKMLKQKAISQALYNEIQLGYSQNKRLFLATEISFLYNNYIKEYIIE